MKPSSVAAVLCVMILFPVLLSAQSTQPDQQQIEQLEHQFRSSPQDVVSPEFLHKYVADNYVWIMPGGEKGRSDLSELKSGQTTHDNMVKDVKVHVAGETAIVNGFWSKRTEDDRGPIQWEGIFQDVWQKQNGSWKLIASATAPFHREKAATAAK